MSRAALIAAHAAAALGRIASAPEPAPVSQSSARPASTYRGARRNKAFGRPAHGNARGGDPNRLRTRMLKFTGETRRTGR